MHRVTKSMIQRTVTSLIALEHEMLSVHWGCKVKKKIYIEKATWSGQSTREEQRHHKANVPVSLGEGGGGGLKQRSVIELK